MALDNLQRFKQPALRQLNSTARPAGCLVLTYPAKASHCPLLWAGWPADTGLTSCLVLWVLLVATGYPLATPSTEIAAHHRYGHSMWPLQSVR